MKGNELFRLSTIRKLINVIIWVGFWFKCFLGQIPWENECSHARNGVNSKIHNSYNLSTSLFLLIRAQIDRYFLHYISIYSFMHNKSFFYLLFVVFLFNMNFRSNVFMFLKENWRKNFFSRFIFHLLILILAYYRW